MRVLTFAAFAALIAPSLGAAQDPSEADPGPMVRALWLFQRYGNADVVEPNNDEHVKAVLAKALGKQNVLTYPAVKELMSASSFNALAGADGQLDAAEVKKALDADEPATRKRLLPKVAEHADLLTTSCDMIGEVHRASGEKLVDWIVANYKPGQPLDVTCVCTGNSRRSVMGATMGNIAADYYGLPEIRFHSGGTKPSACNARAVRALKAIGVEVEPTGEDAPRGEPETANPKYRVRWGEAGESSEPKMETVEFSKSYSDPVNPQKGFAALMVCSEADAACPFVKGSSLRVSMPYLDPKIYDGGCLEEAKYAERRDDLGRLMISVMMWARYQLAAAKKLR